MIEPFKRIEKKNLLLQQYFCWVPSKLVRLQHKNIIKFVSFSLTDLFSHENKKDYDEKTTNDLLAFALFLKMNDPFIFKF